MDPDRRLVVVELLSGGELAVLEQVRDLEECGLLGELLDRIAAVVEDALLAADVGDPRHALGGVAEAAVDGGETQLAAETADVDRDVALDPFDHLEGDLLVSKADNRVGHVFPFSVSLLWNERRR